MSRFIPRATRGNLVIEPIDDAVFGRQKWDPLLECCLGGIDRRLGARTAEREQFGDRNLPYQNYRPRRASGQ